MDPERWQRLRGWFDEAVASPPAERDALLGRVEAADPDLVEPLRELLAHDLTTADGELPALGEAAAPPPPSIGRYRVSRELGRGGMGRVLLGERADGAYRQQVAIKLLSAGVFATDDARRRFLAERAILARLDHPAIARLIDGGTTESGEPFLAMEYVEGLPIDRFCRERALGVEAILRLFSKVCAAVEAAHRRLVVHRDLKPSNVLVTADGEPKLLDFGIAKLLDPDLALEVAAETRRGQLLLTPRYASPEQILAQPITVATDVYSLGVLLYELLTGTSPYRTPSHDPLVVAKAVCEVEPTPPSVAIKSADGGPVRSPGVVASHLRSDLEAIVLKALRKEPAERYGSVAELAVDLERHLGGHPVAARRGSRWYRSGKFARRHRVAVAAAALLAVTVTGFSWSRAKQLQETRRQRDAAEAAQAEALAERDVSRAVTDFLVQLFSAADPSETRGAEVTARELLARGSRRIDAELASQPAVRGQLLATLGRVYASLTLFPEAERHYLEALAVKETLPAKDLTDIGKIRGNLGYVVAQLGDFARSETLLRQALAELRTSPPVDAVEEARLLLRLGGVLAMRNRGQEALPLLEEAVRKREAAPPGSDTVLATAHNNLGLAYTALDRWREAGDEFAFAVAETTRRSGEDHPDLVYMRTNLAWARSSEGDFERAAAAAAEARGLAIQLYGDTSPQTARASTFLGWMLVHLGRFAEARPLLEGGLAIRHQVLANSAPDLMQSHQALARLGWWSGQVDEAQRQLAAGLAIGRRLGLPSTERTVGDLEREWADLLLERGRAPEARPHVLAAAAASDADELPLARADSKVRMAALVLEDAAADPASVREVALWLAEGLAAFSGDGRDHRLGRRRTLILLARLKTRSGALDEAREHLRQALALESTLAPADPQRGLVQRLLDQLPHS